jgi:ornithine cyclodeaminase/alanine dehydrogenase-like protein (mu-crystallin family)
MSLNLAPSVSVDSMMRLVLHVGIERFLADMAGYIEADFRRWEAFDKVARIASHSEVGVIELMPTSDGKVYGSRYVNGHPPNIRSGRQAARRPLNRLAGEQAATPARMSSLRPGPRNVRQAPQGRGGSAVRVCG